MNRNPGTGRPIALYLTGEHDCSYLPDLAARTLFVDPLARIDAAAFQSLLEQGFRRSGSHIYRPACRCCRACISLRLPVEGFRTQPLPAAQLPPQRVPGQGHRPCPDLSTRDTSPFTGATCRPATRRGAMAEGTGENYRDFLVDPWGGETRLLEFRLDERLMAVAVTDVTPGGLSAVYTFFDPDLSDRAPGTFAILCQIEAAKGLGLPYLYLGYWIEACGKMSYKSNFRPLEAWNGREWERFGPGLPVRPRPPRSPSRS